MWFKELVGFDEAGADGVRSQLRVEGTRMRSLVNGREMGCGELSVTSLADLRTQTAALDATGRSRVRELVGDAGALHRDPNNAGATFQAASQFNLLEMVSPSVGPEAGVSGYQNDPTQGPACAVACGAGTIYRNYFVPLGGHPPQVGQTADRQIDCLRPLGEHLFPDAAVPWTMANGYAMFDRDGLEMVNQRLRSMDEAEIDEARARLEVGVHRQVEVTTSPNGHLVTQVYCSALPVAYNSDPTDQFEPLARLILEATYEATLRVAALNADQTGNRAVYLTLVGGGVFGNPEIWIIDAIERAVSLVADADLDIVLVSYRSSNPAVADLVRRQVGERGS